MRSEEIFINSAREFVLTGDIYGKSGKISPG